MKNKLNVLEAIRQSRHDWLNVIQLIKGNLSLKRYDRIEEIVEEVSRQAICESKLSNIDVPELVYFLLTYNWFNYKMKLEFDVIGDVYSLAKEGEHLLRVCEEIMEKLANESSMGTENHVLITFLFKEDECEVTFDYHGCLQDQDEQLAHTVDMLGSNVRMDKDDETECIITVCYLKS